MNGILSLNRRSFLQTGLYAGTAVTAASTPTTQEPGAPAPAKILNYQPEMLYRQLPGTDVYLSIISLGGLVMVEAVHHYAIEHGVNLVHIAQDYLQGQAIVTLARVLKTRRQQVYIALKTTFKDLDETLRKLGTDHVDFLMFNRHNEEAARNPENLQTFQRYKEQGKVRFPGLTSHDNVKAATHAGIESGMYQLLMPSLNQPNLEALDAELRLAKSRDIGVLAMKTTQGVSDPNLRLSYFKKVLQNDAVTSVLKGMESFEMFDAWLKAAHEPLSAEDDKALYRHAQANRSNNCMMCGECRSVCPESIEIAKIIRCNDYYYGQLKDHVTAQATYSILPNDKIGSDDCTTCRKCEAACPNRLAIVDRLASARSLFRRT